MSRYVDLTGLDWIGLESRLGQELTRLGWTLNLEP